MQRQITAAEIPWTSLSERGLEILYSIAIPVSSTHSIDDVAQELGVSTYVVRAHLDALRNEIEDLIK